MEDEYVRLSGRLQALDYLLLELQLQHFPDHTHGPLFMEKERELAQNRRELKEESKQFPEVPYMGRSSQTRRN